MHYSTNVLSLLLSWMLHLMAYRAKEADATTVYPADAIPAIDADEAIVYLADKRAKDEDTAIVYHEKEVLLTKR
ncbi:hypothetical protein H4I96_05808 [Botrytis cinerea]